MAGRRIAGTPGLHGLEPAVTGRWTPEVFRRFQCIWLTEALSLSPGEIARVLGLNVSTVRRIRAAYAREGILAIRGQGNRGGRRNQCMAPQEEETFLRSHPECFDPAGNPDVGALKTALEASVGREIHRTTVYRLLERHGRGGGGRTSGESARKPPPPARKIRQAGDGADCPSGIRAGSGPPSF